MTNNDTQEKERAGELTSGYWTARKWFTFLVAFLLLWIGLFVALHTNKVHAGYKYAKFTPEQIQQINRILYVSAAVNNKDGYVLKNDTLVQVLPADSGMHDSVVSQHTITKIFIQPSICDDSARVNKAMLYIRSEYDNKIEEGQLAIIKEYISTFSGEEVGNFLVGIKLKVASYFWLTGIMVYVEMIFWVIIGVICSILFAIGNGSRNDDGNGLNVPFNPKDIPYHIAKLFYAPFSTIILLLGYNYVKHRNVIEVNTSEGMIVFAFIAGLFSGRLMGIIERIKDVLLPENLPTLRRATATTIEPVAATTQEKPSTNKTTYVTENSTEQTDYSETDNQNFDFDDEPAVDEVSVELRLDVSGLFDEEQQEIMEIGFHNAVVTLHNVNGRDIITAKRLPENGSIFTAVAIRSGIYIARATLSQRLSDDYTINLFGEKTAYITGDNKHIELFIKKYEAID